MDCKNLKFTGHAVQQMFKRKISKDAVRATIEKGEVIAAYPDDKPFPSKLLLGFSEGRPLHVVFAYDESLEIGYVVTAYVPDKKIWDENFKRRK